MKGETVLEFGNNQRKGLLILCLSMTTGDKQKTLITGPQCSGRRVWVKKVSHALWSKTRKSFVYINKNFKINSKIDRKSMRRCQNRGDVIPLSFFLLSLFKIQLLHFSQAAGEPVHSVNSKAKKLETLRDGRIPLVYNATKSLLNGYFTLLLLK